MKAIIALSILIFSSSAFALNCKSVDIQNTQMRFTYHSFHSLYHCDFVERESEKILAELGATNVNLRCTGGLPYSESVFVRASFDRAVAADNGKSNACHVGTRFRYINESCDLHETIIDKYIEQFETADLEKRSSCRDSRGRLEYDFTVLK